MLTISGFDDLERFGIHYLTGEADNLSFRGLCDLTELGRRVVAECFGLAPESFPANWNGGKPDDPAVASCMLSPSAIPDLAIIGLVIEGCTALLTEEGTVFGLEADDSYDRGEIDWETGDYTREPEITLDGETMRWPTCYGKVRRVFDPSPHHHVGTRNVHAATGRAV
ncbi:MAG: hypothetical protein ABIP48_22835 [Planctomycetota bacterium]